MGGWKQNANSHFDENRSILIITFLILRFERTTFDGVIAHAHTHIPSIEREFFKASLGPPIFGWNFGVNTKSLIWHTSRSIHLTRPAPIASFWKCASGQSTFAGKVFCGATYRGLKMNFLCQEIKDFFGSDHNFFNIENWMRDVWRANAPWIYTQLVHTSSTFLFTASYRCRRFSDFFGNLVSNFCFSAISTLPFTISPSNVTDSCFPRQNTSSHVFRFCENSKLLSEIAIPEKYEVNQHTPKKSKFKRFKNKEIKTIAAGCYENMGSNGIV